MNIKEISKNSDDEIYAMLKECSMDPFQTVNKLLEKGRKSKETAVELTESTNTIALYYDRDENMASIPDFGLDELAKATNYFDEKMIILKEEFGVTFKGLLDDGQTVSVKRYNLDGYRANEYLYEIGKLSKLSHPHLVSLIGKCVDSKSRKLILVHEFMKNGTLEDYLFGDKKGIPLSWDQRLRICIDAARGLEYLHHGFANAKSIIHRDINPANILLDEYWTAKISKFGSTLLGNTNFKNATKLTIVMRNDKYVDPYFHITGQLTRGTDIYAFGVVLLDVLFGRMNFNLQEMQLHKWIEQLLKDGGLDGIIDEVQISPESLKEFAELAFSCVRDNPLHRPTMTEVLERLESILKTSQKTQP